MHGRKDSSPLVLPPYGIASPPKTVNAVPRMKKDIYALRKLMGSKLVVKKLVRGTKIMALHYGFGDSSGSGFGSS